MLIISQAVIETKLTGNCWEMWQYQPEMFSWRLGLGV